MIHEGEEAYIGCEAVGLEDVTYEWQVSRDGGETFEEDALVGNEHVVAGLQADAAGSANYLFRCTVTNGDGTATLTADVHIVVLDVPEPASDDGGEPAAKSGKSTGKRIPQLGDEGMIGMTALASAGALGSLALLLTLMRPRSKRKRKP